MTECIHKKIGPLLLCSLLAACAGKPSLPADESQETIHAAKTPEQLRINELERQLAEKQRQCAEDKRRQDVALKENQKKTEELQKKLDALLAIDRDLRLRSKGR